MINGFAGCFIGGFLMTAVPKFSQTESAKLSEILMLLLVTIAGLIFAYQENEQLVFISSSLQPLVLLIFLFRRIFKRKQNPPYSFVFIFVGLFLWMLSGLGSAFIDPETFKHLHYEGAISAIILGVGSRLIPGILGHVEIVKLQKQKYEQLIPIIKTVPLTFAALIMIFIISYFIGGMTGDMVRGGVVAIIGMMYWKLYSSPKDKTALTWSIWTASWLIVLSFILKALWQDGMIHVTHSFFINGIVLLSLLIGTRVLQSHGPQDKTLEDSKVLYVVTGFVVFAAATRVSAYLLPKVYLTHLSYSALMLVLAVAIWSIKYLRYISRYH